jgi:hypothetical protein
MNQSSKGDLRFFLCDDLDSLGAIPVVSNGDAREIELPELPQGGDVNVASEDGDPVESSRSGAIACACDLERPHLPRDVDNHTRMPRGADDQEALPSHASYDVCCIHGSSLSFFEHGGRVKGERCVAVTRSIMAQP